MTFRGDPRTSTAAWRRHRLRVLRRDRYICQLKFDGCSITATEVDHVVSVADGGDDEPTNLQAACTPCHAAKTMVEALAVRRRIAAARRRQPEPHPGRRRPGG